MQRIQRQPRTIIKKIDEFIATRKRCADFVNENLNINVAEKKPKDYRQILDEFTVAFNKYIEQVRNAKYSEATRDYEAAMRRMDDELREFASNYTGKYVILESDNKPQNS